MPNELKRVQESLEVAQAGSKKRTTYVEKDKLEITKYAATRGASAGIRKFRQKFPNLTESTIRSWVKNL